MGYSGSAIKNAALPAAFQTKRLIEKKVAAVKLIRLQFFCNTSIGVVFL